MAQRALGAWLWTGLRVLLVEAEQWVWLQAWLWAGLWLGFPQDLVPQKEWWGQGQLWWQYS